MVANANDFSAFKASKKCRYSVPIIRNNLKNDRSPNLHAFDATKNTALQYLLKFTE